MLVVHGEKPNPSRDGDEWGVISDDLSRSDESFADLPLTPCGGIRKGG